MARYNYISAKVINFGKWYWIAFVLFMCTYFFFDRINKYNSSTRVQGIVINDLWDGYPSKYNNKVGWYPQFQFIYKGTLYTSADLNSNAKKGENVIIIFSHSNPTTAKIYSFFRFWFSIREIMLGVVIAGFFYLIILVADQYNQFLKEEQRRKKEKNKH